MTYTGDVVVGEPADRRELAGVTIAKLAVGPMDNNAYLITCRVTGDALLIDAAAEPIRLIELVGRDVLRTVVTTHHHPDHWQGLEAVVGVTGPAVVAHPLDAPGLPIPVTHEIVHGDVLTVGEASLEVVHLRGHTPGSVALLLRDADGPPHLFTGDSLFPGGPGNTRRDPAAFASLMDDLEQRIFGVLPDETWVYPGHGRDTTLGVERPALPEWRARGW